MSDVPITLVFVGDNAKAKAAMRELGGEADKLGSKLKGASDSAGSSFANATRGATGVKRSVRDIIKESAKMAQASQSAGQSLVASSRHAQAGWKQFLEVAREVRATLAILAGIKLAVSFVSNITQAADAYTNMNSKIRTVVESEEELNRIREASYEIAQHTRSSMDSTITLFTRMTRATTALKLSEQQRLKITETITKAYALSGATVQESTNSIIQLTQALASGVLRGDEFNSVAEQGPIILELLSKSLGKTRGELRAFAAEGKLTSEVIVQAIMQGQSDIDTQFAQVSVTIEGAALRVVNAWQKWIGEVTTANNASRTIANSLTFLADNIDEVSSALLAMGQGLAVVFGGRLIGAMREFVASQVRSVQASMQIVEAKRLELSQTAYMAEARQAELAQQAQYIELANVRAMNDIRAAELKMVNAEATIANTRATIANTVAETKSVEVQLASTRVQIQQARAYIQTATGTAVYNRRMEQLRVLQARNSELSARLTQLTYAEAEARAALTTAINAQNAAHGRLTAAQSAASLNFGAQLDNAMALHNAQTALARSSTVVGRAMGVVGTAFRGIITVGSRLFNLLGGWVMVLGVLGYNLWKFAKDSAEVSSGMRSMSDAVEQLAAKNEALRLETKSGGDTMLASTISMKEKTQATLDQIAAERDAAQSLSNYYMSMTAVTGSVGLSIINSGLLDLKVAQLNKRYAEAEEILEQYNQQLEIYNKLTQFSNVVSGFGTTAPLRTPFDPKAEEEFFSRYSRETFEIEANNIAKEKGRLAEAKFRMEKILGKDAWERSSESQRQSIILWAEYQDAIDKAKEKTTGLSSAQKDAEKAQKELSRTLDEQMNSWSSVNEMIERIADNYRGPVARANMDYRKQMDLLNQALEDTQNLYDHGRISLEEYSERWIAVSQAIELAEKQHKDVIKVAKETEDVVGRTLRSLDEEIDLLKMNNEQRRVHEILLSAEAEHKRVLNREMAPETRENLRLEIQGRLALTDAIERQKNAQEEYLNIWKEGIDRMISAGAQFVTRTIKSFKDFRRAMVDNIRQMVTDMLIHMMRLRVMNGLISRGMASGTSWGNMLLNSSFLGGVGMGSQSGVLGGTLGGAVGGLAQGAGAVASAGVGAGSNFNIVSPVSWINAGKNLWQGFSAAATSSSSIFGSYLAPGSQAATTGNLNMSQAYGKGFGAASGPGTFTPSALAYGIGGAASLYSGYNRYRNTEGGLMGHTAGMSYGFGTYATSMGLASLATGGSFSAGVASMGALGPIGWAAAIAMVVDMISGGKLFGTAYRAQNITQSIGFQGGDGFIDLTRTDVKQRSLFRGRKWREVEMDVPEEMKAEAEKFFRHISQIMVDAATKMGIETPPMIDAAIRTVTEYDKKGNETLTKYFVDILGRTWEESTAELAGTRIAAEAIVATVAASEAGQAASKIAEQWRSNAEDLMEGAQLLLLATTDINRGKGLLSYGPLAGFGADSGTGGGGGSTGGGAGSGGSGSDWGTGIPTQIRPMTAFKAATTQAVDMLESTVKIVQELQREGESLEETYKRLYTNAELLNISVELAGVNLNKSAEEFVRFATRIEEAAGGLDRATELWTNFFDNFYSPGEIRTRQFEDLTADVESQLSSLGLTAETSMMDFRLAFEEALPTLSPEEVVKWLSAGEALARFTSWFDEINSMLRDNDLEIESFGMSDYEQALRNVNTKFDEMRTTMEDLGATTDHLLILEAQRNQVLLQQSRALLESFGYITAASKTFTQIRQQATDSVDALNRVAIAAGYAGAAERDLARVREVAAYQTAQAIAELTSATRSLVDTFYGRGQTVAQQASAGVDSVQSFGNAIEKVSDKIRETVRIMLGDLSPLNDNQKLQYALDALSRGEASREDVLGIGRRLYASSQAYTDLFNRVMAMNVPESNSGPGGGGDFSSGGGGSAFIQEYQRTEEEIARERRDAADQITRNIATLSNVTGRSYQDIAEEFQVSLEDLANEFGMSQESFLEYLDQLVDQENAVPQAVMDGADRIIEALYNIFDGVRPYVNEDEQTEVRESRGPERVQIEAPSQWSDQGRTRISKEAREVVVNAVTPQAENAIVGTEQAVLSTLPMLTVIAETIASGNTGIVEAISAMVNAIKESEQRDEVVTRRGVRRVIS